MSKKPVWYTDWREVLWRESRHLGMLIVWQINTTGKMTYNRDVYEYVHRLRRIQARLDVEHKVMDRTLVNALLDMFLDD